MDQRRAARWRRARFGRPRSQRPGRPICLIGETATTFLLDRAGRLWLGADNGEWGGWVARIDLANGDGRRDQASARPRARRYRNRWDGVYGFVERRDGQILAFGGTSHMGLNSGLITRVDQAEPRQAVRIRSGRTTKPRQPDPGRPRLPITHVVEEDNGLLVLSYSDVFRVDSDFTSWKKAATLEIAYRWGRPDAVGSYPSVRAVIRRARRGGSICSPPIGDGYVSLEGAKTTTHGIPGQLGASASVRSRTRRREPSSSRTTTGSRAGGWARRAGRSRRLPARWSPTRRAISRRRETEARRMVRDARAGEPGRDDLHGERNRISARYADDGTPDERKARTDRPGDVVAVLQRARSITADGTLWNAFSARLKRFEKGQWETVARLSGGAQSFRPEAAQPERSAVAAARPFQHDLWRLDHGATGETPGSPASKLREAGRRSASATRSPGPTARCCWRPTQV